MGVNAKVATALGVLVVLLGGVVFLKVRDHAGERPPGELAANLTDQAIHAYLLSHPEVLREMSVKLAEKDREEQQAKFNQALPELREQLTLADQKAVSGNPKGDITIVEFYDVECPFCKAQTPDLDRLVKDDEYIRVVYREYPILGEMSVIGARAEIAAEKQGLYGQFHAALMADSTPEHQLSEKRIFQLAASAGLDVSRLKRDMADPDVERRIAAYNAEAVKLQITGTPGLIFLGPKGKANFMSPGLMNYDAMKAKLAELRLAAR